MRRMSGHALEAVHQAGDGNLGRVVHQEVHVVAAAVYFDELGFEVSADHW